MLAFQVLTLNAKSEGKTRPPPPLQRSGLISSLTDGIVGGFVLVAALVILLMLYFNFNLESEDFLDDSLSFKMLF